MSNEVLLLGVVVGGTIAGYYLIQEENSATVLAYTGGGALVGGIAVPSMQAQKLVFDQNKMIIGLVVGTAAYFAMNSMAEERRGINVRRRVCSHCD